MGWFSINMKFLPLKIHYVLFNGGTATVQPTMPVYAKVLGFSSFVVGTIYTILPILGLIIKPAFGALADKFKWHRGVLLAWELIVIVSYFGVWFIPPAHPQGPSNTTEAFNIRGVSACSFAGAPPYLFVEGDNCSWSCDLTPQRCADWQIYDACAPYDTSDYSVGTSSWPEERCVSLTEAPSSLAIWQDSGCKSSCKLSRGTREVDDPSETYSEWQFWLFLVLLVGAWGGTSVATTITDTLCIEICEDPYLYGKQRLWASFGWGLFSIINGFAIDAVSTEGEEKNYAPAFYIMLPPLLIDLFFCYRLKFTIPEQSENIVKDVWKVMLRPRNAVFMVWCAMVGASFGLVWNFLYWYLEDLATAQGPEVFANIKTIEGLVAGFETFIGEIPAFFFGGWIINKIGHGHSITLVFTAIGLRYTLYSILVNPWWSLPIEILQNNYGLFYSAMTSYAKEIAPPGTEATIQSVLCAICEGVGVAIGSFLGGLFYDKYGGSITFRIFGIAFFVLAVTNECIQLIYRILDRREASKISPLPEYQQDQPSNGSGMTSNR